MYGADLPEGETCCCTAQACLKGNPKLIGVATANQQARTAAKVQRLQ